MVKTAVRWYSGPELFYGKAPGLASLYLRHAPILRPGYDLSVCAHRTAIDIEFLETGEEAPLETRRESFKSLKSKSPQSLEV